MSDVLDGGPGDDELLGFGGADLLYGGAGKDELIGGGDNDLLVGGADADTQTGGNGSDIFAFVSTADSRPGTPDTIVDFQEHVDTAPPSSDFEATIVLPPDIIALTLIDANTRVRGDQAFTFVLGDDPDHRTAVVLPNSVTWHYEGTKGNASAPPLTIVQADVNGDTTAEVQIVLMGFHSLTAADFAL